jgi:hypothetical protein
VPWNGPQWTNCNTASTEHEKACTIEVSAGRTCDDTRLTDCYLGMQNCNDCDSHQSWCKKCRMNETVHCCSPVNMLQMYGWLSWLFFSWILYYGMFIICSNVWFFSIITPCTLLIAKL